MDIEKIRVEIDRQFEQKITSIVNDIQVAMRNKEIVKDMMKRGYYDPVLPYYSFIGGFRNFYASLPLDKPLFHRIIQEMGNLGWEAGKIELDSNTACVTLKKSADLSVEYSPELSVVMHAYGEGVACRIVELVPQQSYEQGIYEWVCEKGVEEEVGW